MSSIIEINALMYDLSCITQALTENGETYAISGKDILITTQNSFFNQKLIYTVNGYKLSTRNINLEQRNDWLKKIKNSYDRIYQKKLEQQSAEEKRKIEDIKKQYVHAQENTIIEKAKKLGYKIDKRVEKDGKIQLVLVKRAL